MSLYPLNTFQLDGDAQLLRDELPTVTPHMGGLPDPRLSWTEVTIHSYCYSHHPFFSLLPRLEEGTVISELD